MNMTCSPGKDKELGEFKKQLFEIFMAEKGNWRETRSRHSRCFVFMWKRGTEIIIISDQKHLTLEKGGTMCTLLPY